MKETKNLCLYYQGTIKRSKVWFVVGVLRNEDHLVFERALDKKTGTFEFFVPPAQEDRFLRVMQALEKIDIVHSLEKVPHRYFQQQKEL